MIEKKIPLVLLPGLLSNEWIWQHQVNHLREIASIQVLPAIQETTEKMVEEILAKAPPEFALAGHSMGGWLCLEIMKIAPLRVRKLCLLNTTARSDSREKARKRQEMILRAKRGSFGVVAKEIVDHFVFNSFVKEEVHQMFLDVGKEVFINQQNAMLERKECQSVLSRIDCPTLVVHAMRDSAFSLEDHRELTEKISGAKMAIIEDAGHMSPLEVPQAISAFLRFWLIYF